MESQPLRRVVWGIGGLVVGWLFFRYLLTPLLPFLLALGLSALLEPWVQRLRRALQVRRAFAAVVLTTALLLVVGGALTFLVLKLGMELAAWSEHLPEAIDAFPALWNGALNRIEGWYISCPSFLRSTLDFLATALGENTTAVVGKAGGVLMEKISALAAALPHAGLFCVTTILALYFTSVSYSNILSFLKRQLPVAWQKRGRAAVRCCRSTLLVWLRAELLLIFVTFLILLTGFWLMQLPYALLAAFAIALVDALPVLGTGTVLLPWAAFRFLLGDTAQGMALVALYAVALLTHSLLEPRLLAKHSHLPPIAVLLVMYLGYHLVGVSGMILFPICLLLIKQLQDAGVIHLWQ